MSFISKLHSFFGVSSKKTSAESAKAKFKQSPSGLGIGFFAPFVAAAVHAKKKEAKATSQVPAAPAAPPAVSSRTVKASEADDVEVLCFPVIANTPVGSVRRLPQSPVANITPVLPETEPSQTGTQTQMMTDHEARIRGTNGEIASGSGLGRIGGARAVDAIKRERGTIPPNLFWM